MKVIVLFIALVFSYSPTRAQSWERQRDSLMHLLPAQKEDTLKAIMLLDIGWTFINSNTDSAVYYFKACNQQSKKLHFATGELRYRFCYTQVLYMQGKYEEELSIDLETPALALQIPSPDGWLLSCYSNIANDYVNVNRGDSAMEYYQKAIALAERIGRKTPRVYSNMVGYYKLLGIHPRAAYAYGLKSIAMSREMQRDDILDQALSHTGHVLIDIKKYDSALLLQQQAKEIAERIDDKVFETEVLLHINELLVIKGDYNGLRENAEKIGALSVASDNREGVADGKLYMSIWHFYRKEFDAAKLYADSVLQISVPHKIDHTSQAAYLLLSDIYLGSGDLEGYKRARASSDSLSDIFESGQLIKNAQDIEGKYSLDKKQSEINNLNAEKKIQKLTIRQTGIILTALFIIVAVLIFIGFLFYRNQQQRKKLLMADAALQKKRITELENEKQLLAAQAVLQGHEEERSRLAKDLHDGLGGILSGVKYSLNHLKSNFIITPEGATALDRSMVLLDKSITELRTVSHNMMPEALANFGLDTALKDYCNAINRSGALILNCQLIDITDESIAKNTSAVIYRIIQELINNIMKHADAKNALIQLIRKGDALSITVEDDGKGFNKQIADYSDGMGLANLKNRVIYLKGTIDVQTAPGKGTSVNIEIPDIRG